MHTAKQFLFYRGVFTDHVFIALVRMFALSVKCLHADCEWMACVNQMMFHISYDVGSLFKRAYCRIIVVTMQVENTVLVKR